MNNKINLDDLLKEEMGNLSPEPPANLWQNISSQLPDVVTTSSTTTAAAKTVIGVSVKSAVIAVATIAAGVVGYVMYTPSNNTSSSNIEKENTTLVETLPEAKNVEENQTSDETTPINQTAELPKGLISIPKSKKIQNKISACGDFPDEEVPVDMPAPTPIQSNKELVNNEDIVSVNREQQNIQNNTEQSQEENKQTPNTSSSQSTASEEFLKPNIPNVFTPNNDGYNDEYVITIENEVLYDLKITDAKGNVIFESKDKNKHWNGTNQKTGEACEPGVYVMAFRYQLNGMKEAKVEKGLILLKL